MEVLIGKAGRGAKKQNSALRCSESVSALKVNDADGLQEDRPGTHTHTHS